MTSPLRIGTRGSRLALCQANSVAALLRPLLAPRPLELIEIQTAGDQVLDVPLPQIGGEGVFTKEIQNALLDGRVDVAVHSLKDCRQSRSRESCWLQCRSADRRVMSWYPGGTEASRLFRTVRG